MKRIQQRHKNGCAIACLAMLAGLTYQQALKTAHPKRKNYSDVSCNLLTLNQSCFKYGITLQAQLFSDFKTLPLSLLWLKFDNQIDHVVIWNPATQQILEPANIKRDLEWYQDHVFMVLNVTYQ